MEIIMVERWVYKHFSYLTHIWTDEDLAYTFFYNVANNVQTMSMAVWGS